MNNLTGFCLICFKFSPHFCTIRQCKCGMNLGAKGCVLQELLDLFKSKYYMFAIELKMDTLCIINAEQISLTNFLHV